MQCGYSASPTSRERVERTAIEPDHQYMAKLKPSPSTSAVVTPARPPSNAPIARNRPIIAAIRTHVLALLIPGVTVITPRRSFPSIVPWGFRYVGPDGSPNGDAYGPRPTSVEISASRATAFGNTKIARIAIIASTTTAVTRPGTRSRERSAASRRNICRGTTR